MLLPVLRISDFAVHAPNNFGDVFFVVADEFADFRIGVVEVGVEIGGLRWREHIGAVNVLIVRRVIFKQIHQLINRKSITIRFIFSCW